VHVLGLAAGDYTLRLVPVRNGSEDPSAAIAVGPLVVRPHRREGFAFAANSPAGTGSGGYRDDGTLAESAQVIVVSAANINSVALDVVTGVDGRTTHAVGIERILYYRGKAFDTRPLVIRVVGLIRATDVNGLKSGRIILIKGGGEAARISNITLEGVGDDATFHGIGLLLGNSKNIEIRNLGFMHFDGDAVSLEGHNHNTWVHHCDFFYGIPGRADDQIKGDGSIDMKYDSSFITISHNHFFDSGKTTFAGGEHEEGPVYFTYHHNWFDHADSRVPRLTNATAHIYNNYMDGNHGMGVLATEGSCAFIEGNYFRNTKLPMTINRQGANARAWPKGRQDGGIIKAYANVIVGESQPTYQTQSPTDFDAYLVTDRSERIPDTVRTVVGNHPYSNFDTEPTMYVSRPDAAEQVPQIVMRDAGRLGGGDFRWTFTLADDKSTEVNAALNAALAAYVSKLQSIDP